VWRLLRDMPLGLVLYDEQFRIVYQNLASEANEPATPPPNSPGKRRSACGYRNENLESSIGESAPHA